MNVPTRDEHEQLWALQVGHFSIGVGGIEWATDSILESIGVKLDTGASFYSRLGLLKKSIAQVSPSLQSKLLELIDQADSVRQLRNAVLHSTVAISFYFEGIDPAAELTPADVEGARLLLQSHVNDRSGKHLDIDLDRMTKLAASARILSDEFWKVAISQFHDSRGEHHKGISTSEPPGTSIPPLCG